MKKFIGLSGILAVVAAGCVGCGKASTPPGAPPRPAAGISVPAPASAAAAISCDNPAVKTATLVDVRSQKEFNEGHFDGALLLPHTRITEQAGALLPDKNMPIQVYCRTGKRSAVARERLIQLGYTRVEDLGGLADATAKLQKPIIIP